MYSLEYLPLARRDLVEAVTYISHELDNPAAAYRLAQEVSHAEARIQAFPYACPVYQSTQPLRHEYRKLLVQNYLVLYWVDEEQKLVTVARVVYARRDYGALLQ